MATLNDFGAPGTTSTDIAEGVNSDADVQVKDPGTKQISKPVASFAQGDKPLPDNSTPWNDYKTTTTNDTPPWEDFKTNPLKGNLGASAKAAGKEFLAAADTIAGIPAFLFNAIETPIMSGEAAVMGSGTPFKDARTAMENGFNNTKLGRFMASPISNTLGISTEGTMVKGVFDDIGKIIDRTASGAQAATGSPEASEAVKQIANLVMLKGGDIAMDTLKDVHSALKKDPVAIINGDMPSNILPNVKAVEPKVQPPITQFATDNDGTVRPVDNVQPPADVNAIPQNVGDKLTMEAKASAIPELTPKPTPAPEASVDDGYIPFEKVDPNSLKTKQQSLDFSDPGMDFTTHATPQQGSDIVSGLQNDMTPAVKGEPGQFDIPGINKPLSRKGGMYQDQGGYISFDPEGIRDTIKKAFSSLADRAGLVRTPEVLKATKTLDDELNYNRNMKVMDDTLVRQAYTELQMKVGLTDTLDRKFIDVLENPNMKLSPDEQRVYDEGMPFAQSYFEHPMKEYAELGGKENNYDTGIFPRFALGKGGIMDRMIESVDRGQGPLVGNKRSVPSGAKTRTTFALEHPDGTRQVITLGHDNSMTAWDNGKPSLIANFDGPMKLGMELEGGNFEGAKIKQATFSEAQQHTDTKYFPNAIETLLYKGNEFRDSVRTLKTIDRLKNSPEFSQFAAKEGSANVPSTWRKADISNSGLTGWVFEPNIAETLEDYMGNRTTNGAAKTLQLIQNGILKAMFLWPLPHMNNEGLHWIPSRGLEGWFTPGGIKELQQSAGPAIESVLKQDDLQRRITEAGGQLMYPQIANEYYWKSRVDSTLNAIKTQEPFKQLAKDLATTPFKLAAKMSEYSNKGMWAVRDMMVTELFSEESKKNPNVSDQEIMQDIERHMPNYRIPNRVMGSRSVAQIMKEPLVSVFSYYHYGMAKSFGEFAKSLAAPIQGQDINWRSAGQEFTNGVSKATMLGAMYAIIYPAFDKTMEMASGIPGKFRRAGGLALLDKAGKVVTGKEPPQNLINALITTAPGLQTVMELKNNTNAYTGQKVNPNLGKFTADKFSPLRTAESVTTGKKSAKEALLEYGLDYKAKTTADLIKEASGQ